MRTWPFRDYEPPKGEPLFVYGWQPIPDDQTTLAEILRSKGYDAMFVTDTYHQFEPSYNFHRGFDAYYFIRGQTTDHFRPLWMCPQEKLDQSLLKGGSPVAAKLRRYFANNYAKGAERKSEEDWFAPQVFMRSAELLNGAGQEQPFFLCVDCYDPHEPWDPPEKYIRIYDPDGYEDKEPLNDKYGKDDYLTNRQLLRMRALYSAEITMADRWLGNFLQRAQELQLMENTLLILLSDHGHALGEHGYTGKPHYALWPELTDIPFFIRHPEGNGAGLTSDYYASTHDVAPTVLGMLGMEPPQPMEGHDLSVLLNGKEPKPRDHFTSAYKDHVWTRDENYVMFARNDGEKARLYDVRTDPQQTRDLAEDAPETVEKMFQEYVLRDAGGSLPTH
jgi:arylsulfatase A-like enzyme